MKASPWFFCLLLFPLPLNALAEDWPQWQGPRRDNLSAETGLLQTWPAEGPRRVWLSKEVGLGYAGMAVVGETLYTMGARGEDEYLIALNTADGSERWSLLLGPLLKNNWGDGPRGTPTVDGGQVFVLSGVGNLVCASAEDGSELWRVAMKDLNGRVPGWGYTESVLVDGDRVVCTPGGRDGSVAAFNRETGEKLWQSEDFTEGAQYASVIVAEHAGKRQYIQLFTTNFAGFDSTNGELLWKADFPGKTAVIPTPIFHDGHVYITAGYGAGCKLVKLDGLTPVEVYENKNMKNHHGGVVLLDGKLYGYSDGPGWMCQDFLTGEEVWTEKNAGKKGSLTYADGRLYLLEENTGAVILIAASPAGWEEHGRFTLSPQTEQRKPSGKIWTHPTIANGRLYLRDQELLFSFDISKSAE